MHDSLSQSPTPRIEAGEPAANFDTALNSLAESIPEIAEHYESIEARGRELTERHNLDPAFFESRARTLLFAAIAQRAQGIADNTAGLDAMSLEKEQRFIDNATLLLAKEHAPSYEGDPRKEDPIARLLYGDPRLVDQEATEELQKAINQNDLLGTSRQALGVMKVDEAPFTLRVLPGEIADPVLRDEVEALLGPGRPFGYVADHIGANWRMNGMTYLTIGKTIAQAVLAGDTTVLRHEYIHTQKNYRIDEGSFGGVFEEERAMLLSNDSSSPSGEYNDIIGLFEAFEMITNINVDELIRGNPLDPDKFYEQLAVSAGLQSTLELAAASSAQFAPRHPGLERDVYLYIGDIHKVVKRIEHRALQTDDERMALQARARAYATQHNRIPPFLGDRLGY